MSTLERNDETDLTQILACSSDIWDYLEEAEDKIIIARNLLATINKLVSKELANQYAEENDIK